MTKSIKTISFEKDQPAEILSDERSIRLVRLNFHHGTYGGTQEYLAELGEGLVTLISMADDLEPKKMRIDPDNMTRLAHSWLQFLADCDAKLEQEKAEFQAEIEQERERATALGASMTDFNLASHYGTFNLLWPAGHALERFNRNWHDGNVNLSLNECRSRLKYAEEHIEMIQTEALTDKRDISTPERQADRASAVGGFLTADSDEHNEHTRYWLAFPEGHAFHGFWHQYEDLTAGQVEYRLRYVEGVLKQQASK